MEKSGCCSGMNVDDTAYYMGHWTDGDGEERESQWRIGKSEVYVELLALGA